jgi:hypothetical protein
MKQKQENLNNRFEYLLVSQHFSKSRYHYQNEKENQNF